MCGTKREIVPFGTSCVWTNDNAVLYREMFADPSECAWLGVEIVHGNIEETLNLAGVEIHCNHMVAPGSLKHVGHEFGCDGRARLVLLVLARIWEVRNHGCDPACRCRLACIDHDQELHEGIVDVAWRRRLQDEHCRLVSRLSSTVPRIIGHTIFISDRLANSHRSLLVRVLEHQYLGEFNSKPASNQCMLCRSNWHPQSSRARCSIRSA